MVFKKGNTYGIANTKTLTDLQIALVNELLSHNEGLQSIAKTVGTSTTKLYAIGIKAQNRKNRRLRAKKNSLVNPSNIKWYADLSDITFKSIRVANKNARVLKWGNQSIKLAILASKDKAYIQLTKVTSRGETKQLWANLLKIALENGYNDIAIDTNCKFKDTHLNLVHLVKDSKHPYNNIVEAKIGNLKTKIYNNIKRIKKMSIDEAITEIEYLASRCTWGKEQFTNEALELMIKANNETLKTISPINKALILNQPIAYTPKEA